MVTVSALCIFCYVKCIFYIMVYVFFYIIVYICKYFAEFLSVKVEGELERFTSYGTNKLEESHGTREVKKSQVKQRSRNRVHRCHFDS